MIFNGKSKPSLRENCPSRLGQGDDRPFRRRTGSYRPEDLRRLLGDPIRAVEVGPNASLASFFRPSSADNYAIAGAPCPPPFTAGNTYIVSAPSSVNRI